MKKNLFFLVSILFLSQTLLSQQNNWAIYQSGDTASNISFQSSTPVLKNPTVIPRNPHNNSYFSNFLALNSQTDKAGNLLFYLISTSDSVYLFNSNNVCVDIFPEYDISPLIIPLPGGIKYHIVVGEYLYDLDLKALTNSVYGDILMRSRVQLPLSRIAVGQHSPSRVSKRCVKILYNSCDSISYRIFTIAANNMGYTGRYLIATDIIWAKNNLSHYNSDSYRIDNQLSTDINFNYSLSEMELSQDQNELFLSGSYCFLRIDVSDDKFGNVVKQCIPSNNTVDDSTNNIIGTEYLNDSLVLFSVMNYNNQNSNNQGVFVYNRNQNLFNKVPNSEDFKSSYLEKDRDGTIYMLKADGLYHYDFTNDTIINSLSFTASKTYSFLHDKTLDDDNVSEIDSFVKVFYLPNQIDYFESAVLEDKNAIVDHIIIKTPPALETNYFSNSFHNLTPKGKGEIIVFDSLIITNIADWVIFDSMTIKFYENAKLLVIGGADLELKGTKLMATCGEMWKGIEILQNENYDSRIICRKNTQGRKTLIRDAITAIKTRNFYHGLSISDSTIFMANENGIELNNADSYFTKITNTFFLDTAKLNNGNNAKSAINIYNSSDIIIGNNDSWPIQIIGGIMGINAISDKQVIVKNTHISETLNEAIKMYSVEKITVENCKFTNCNIKPSKTNTSSLFVSSFKNFIAQKNIIKQNLNYNTGIFAECHPTSNVNIGGELQDSNHIDIYEGTAIECKINKTPTFNNSISRSFEFFGRPFIFQIPLKQSIRIENNQISGSSLLTGINTHYDLIQGKKYLLDTLIIHQNNILAGNGIIISNIQVNEPNQILPMGSDWSSGLYKRHVSKNRITLNTINSSNNLKGILIDASDHIYCVNNYIDQNSTLNSNIFGLGIKILNSSNTLLNRDSMLNLNKGIEIQYNNIYSNIYCNYFNNNINCITLDEPILRNHYTPFKIFNKTVHGNFSPNGYIARIDEYNNVPFNRCIFNNEKVKNPFSNKWILNAQTRNNPYLLSNTKNKAFIFNNLGTYDCSYTEPGSNVDSTLENENNATNDIESFWQNYTTSKYNLLNGFALNLNIFEDQILNLETLIDTGTEADINSALNSITPNNQFQSEIKNIFQLWAHYVYTYDTSFIQNNVNQKIRVWTNDSTWLVKDIQTDTAHFRLSYEALSDSTYLLLDSLSKVSPYKTSPSAYFARNFLRFAGYQSNYQDTVIYAGPYLTGRVTANCSGGGNSGITVELYTEYGNSTGLTTTTEDNGYFRFTDIETNLIDSSLRYYVRVYLPNDSNHISTTNYIHNLINDSLLNIDCIFPGPQPLTNNFFPIKEIQLSPNPTDNKIFLSNQTDHTEYSYTIKNSIGKTIISDPKIGISNKNAEIETSQLPDGLYFLSIKSKTTKESKTFKFIVSH